MYGELASAASAPAHNRAYVRLHAVRPATYIAIIIGTAIAACLYTWRYDGIFACPADGYTSDYYLANCSGRTYGTYEHGAFWFGLEPKAIAAAHHAQAMFLGDSRLQVAFSTSATEDWFAQASANYYLLGFGFGENVVFSERILRKLKSEAKVDDVNLDTFFGPWVTEPTKQLMHDASVEDRYETKRRWQFFHRTVCGALSWLCGENFAVFRSSKTGAFDNRGAYDTDGNKRRQVRVSYDHDVDQDRLRNDVASARPFLSRLPARRECVIFTVIPYVRTRIDTARAVANSLGLSFIAPELDGLETFDKSHLDKVSAQRWSAAFFAAAGPQIQKCLGTHVSTAHGTG